MKNVGFYGGCLILDLGPAVDMQLFFECVRFCITELPNGTDGGLLTDRLYRRYLRLEELDPAAKLVGQIREILTDTSTDTVNWTGFKPSQSRLDPSLPHLGALFDRYLNSALDLISNARGFQKKFNIYKPVITIITDTPRFYIERSRPLADYDALEGKPMWLR